MDSARAPVPDTKVLSKLAKAAAHCRACPLWKNATQTVFGEGPVKAKIMLVGEAPGNDEDLAGHPFIGPAGKLLNEALEEAGINRSEVYVTNVVKHFKWEPSGKRRLHKKPSAREIAACKPWLEAEIKAIGPSVLVCLGATAAQTLLGPEFRVTKQRGKFISSALVENVIATVHPSSILRMPDKAIRDLEKKRFVEDLKKAVSRTSNS